MCAGGNTGHIRCRWLSNMGMPSADDRSSVVAPYDMNVLAPYRHP